MSRLEACAMPAAILVKALLFTVGSELARGGMSKREQLADLRNTEFFGSALKAFRDPSLLYCEPDVIRLSINPDPSLQISR